MTDTHLWLNHMNPCQAEPTHLHVGPTMGLGFNLLIYEGARIAACPSTKPIRPTCQLPTYPQSICLSEVKLTSFLAIPSFVAARLPFLLVLCTWPGVVMSGRLMSRSDPQVWRSGQPLNGMHYEGSGYMDDLDLLIIILH